MPGKCLVEALSRTASEAFGALTTGGIKVVLRGAAVPLDKPGHTVSLKEGDHLLVAPQRKAPSAEVVAAATATRGVSASREDDEEEHVALPPGAPKWEVACVDLLRTRAGCADWLLEWVVLVRPSRFLAFVAFLLGCVAASRVGLGPVFLLGGMMYAIFANLGKRKAGDVSAYSIFNRGVRRLPGQLDADQIDRQIRQGHM